MKKTIQTMQQKRKIDVACQFITCISNDEKKARERAKKTVAFYVSVGDIYRKFLAENGFREEVEQIHGEYLRSGFKSNHEMVTDGMLESLTISGLPSQAREQLARIYDAGVTHPIIQFNPIGDTMESFDLLTSTLSDTR